MYKRSKSKKERWVSEMDIRKLLDCLGDPSVPSVTFTGLTPVDALVLPMEGGRGLYPVPVTWNWCCGSIPSKRGRGLLRQKGFGRRVWPSSVYLCIRCSFLVGSSCFLGLISYHQRCVPRPAWVFPGGLKSHLPQTRRSELVVTVCTSSDL